MHDIPKTEFTLSPSITTFCVLFLFLPLTILMSGCSQRLAPISIENLPAAPLPRRFLWVEVLGTPPAISSPDSIGLLFDDAERLGVTDLLVQVYRAGDAWFKSSFANHGDLDRLGFDPLSLCIDQGRKRGIKVHAWINLLNLAENKNARILSVVGKEVLLTDNLDVRVDRYSSEGRPPDDRSKFFSLGSPGLWLDPGNPSVVRYQFALISELLNKYPNLDGIHLDYFRYPYLLPIRPSSGVPFGFDFGYGRTSKRLFEREIGESSAFVSDSKTGQKPSGAAISRKWDQWRRSRLDKFIVDVNRNLNNDQELTVAVLSWSDRAYLSSYQDWRGWLQKGLVDGVMPMAYTKDMDHFGYMIQQGAAFGGFRGQVYAGIGTWILDDLEIQEQIEKALTSGAAGTALFSYRNLKLRPKLPEVNGFAREGRSQLQ